MGGIEVRSLDNSPRTKCRVCDEGLPAPIFSAPAPSVTSITALMPCEAVCYLCSNCGHVQSPTIPDTADYFDTKYRFSLESDDHDQIYDTVHGKVVYRSTHQANLVEATCDLFHGARILDYGAGKAKSTKLLVERISGMSPHVFDVSEDYKQSWHDWLPSEQQACYTLPSAWSGSFDVVTSYFAFQYIPDPVRALRDIASVLKPSGRLFMLVPDVTTNPSDLIIAEHVNHFTVNSLTRALERAGLHAERIETGHFRGGFLVTAKPNPVSDRIGPNPSVEEETATVMGIAQYWQNAQQLLAASKEALAGRRLAIYGAGVFGTFVASRLQDCIPIHCFLDRNPFLQAKNHLGLTVADPDQLPPEVDTVIVALNPVIAHAVAEDWVAKLGRADLRIIHLDDAIENAFQ